MSKESGGTKIALYYQNAFTKAIKFQLKSQVLICCMGMTPEKIFDLYITLPEPGEEMPIMRNSDDFFPDQPKSHFNHLLSNALNGLFMR